MKFLKYYIILLVLLSPFFVHSQSYSTLKLYKNLDDTTLSFRALSLTMSVLNKIPHKNDTIISIVDYTKPSTEKRFFIIDIKNQKILKKTYVAHGMNTGENYAVKFSNKSHSNMSSAGFYLTEETYIGKHGYSLRLKGLEEGINDNARSRAIVLHGAWYVSEDFISRYGRLGRSFGCVSVIESEAREIIDWLKNGTIMFLFTNDKSYYENSILLKK